MGKHLMVQEGDYLAVFNSAHRVMKAETILKSRNLPVILIPAPRQLQTDCGLALRFNNEIYTLVLQYLSSEDLLPVFITRFINGVYELQELNKKESP